MKRLSFAIVFSLAAVALFAYNDDLPWVYDTSSHPAETVAVGTASSASGVDARAYVALAAETTPSGDSLETRSWVSWLSEILELEHTGFMLIFR